MIKVHLTFVFLLLSIITSAQSWQWARSAGGVHNEESLGIAVDSIGNYYITGHFISPFITFGSTTITNVSGRDIITLKYDALGNVLWVNHAGGTGEEQGRGIAVDDSGNVYVTGYFRSPTIAFGNVTLSNAGSEDIFILKYDTFGNVVWANSVGGTNYDAGEKIALDDSGNVYVTGYFSSTFITFGSTILNRTGGRDIFIVKYDPNGSVLWAKNEGGAGCFSEGNSIATDSTGHLYLTGRFQSNSISFGTNTLNYAGGNDFFVVKYDGNGNVIWAKGVGGVSSEEGVSIFSESNGSVFVTGYFQSPSISFDSITLVNSTVNLYSDIFTVKYDSNGNVLWANSAGGTDRDFGMSIIGAQGGNVYVAGCFQSPSILFGTTILTNAGISNSDIFIVKYDVNGNALWSYCSGGNDFDVINDLVMDESENLYATGSFRSSSISFGTTMLTNTSSNYYDIFVAKFGEVTGVEENNFSNGINIFPNPSLYGGSFTISGLPYESVITIHNLLGEVVLETTASGPHETLKLDGPAGIFFLRVRWGTGQEVRRIEVVR